MSLICDNLSNSVTTSFKLKQTSLQKILKYIIFIKTSFGQPIIPSIDTMGSLVFLFSEIYFQNTRVCVRLFVHTFQYTGIHLP